MDQVKIGKLLQELRKEKGMTQEALAEHFSVARRTVSRWETGSNLPDLDILMELADFHGVELRELLNGERTGKEMNKELEETVLQVAEYSNAEKTRAAKIVRVYFILGIIGLAVNTVMTFLDLEGNFLIGFLQGATIGIALAAMILGLLYTSGRMERFLAFKRRLLRRDKEAA